MGTVFGILYSYYPHKAIIVQSCNPNKDDIQFNENQI